LAKAAQDEESKLYPACNSRWAQGQGGIYWCTGGHVPRKVGGWWIGEHASAMGELIAHVPLARVWVKGSIGDFPARCACYSLEAAASLADKLEVSKAGRFS
jgi:hypothetical protein